MEAIISRPKMDAKQSPVRKQAKHSEPVPARPTETERLQTEALQILHYLCRELSETDLSLMPRAQAEAIECDTVIFNLVHPEESDGRHIGVLESLAILRQCIHNTFECLEDASGPNVPAAAASAALLEFIDTLAARLHAAIAGLPGTLEDLRALTTFAGIKTFRDRPIPPIQPTTAPAHQPTHETGEVGTQLALRCTWEVDALACEIAKLAGRVREYDPLPLESMLLCYSHRMQALNNLVMAHLDQDGTTAGEIHNGIFFGSRPFAGDQK